MVAIDVFVIERIHYHSLVSRPYLTKTKRKDKRSKHLKVLKWSVKYRGFIPSHRELSSSQRFTSAYQSGNNKCNLVYAREGGGGGGRGTLMTKFVGFNI